MADSDQESTGSVPGHPGGALQLRQGPRQVLPPFWGDNVAAWFASAESRFRMKRIYDEWDRYDIVVAALSKDDIRLVLDVVTAPPDDDPYTTLKERLLSTHVKTDYQRIEEMLAMDSLGSRKPSEMLAHMLELCPAGEERTKFFAYHFLHRLPQELRIMLSEDDHQEVHQLARKADRLWAIHGHCLHGSVAAAGPAAASADGVNAVRGGAAQKRGSQQRGGGRGRYKPPKSGPATSTAPAALARDSAGLCFFHWNFGEQANKCEPPCTWQGN